MVIDRRAANNELKIEILLESGIFHQLSGVCSSVH